jgi:hypothetical protein
MEEKRLSFDEIVKYAELLGFEHRGEPSRAVDFTYTFWMTPHYDRLMVLYEGKKRVVRGRSKAEVCWICIHKDGKVSSVPSRHIRQFYTNMPGFPLTDEAKEKIYNKLKEAE